jgi:DNA adenine methylase
LDAQAFYIDLRSRPGTSRLGYEAARVIFLNQTCFNGLWRVNQAGEFNVPFGGMKRFARLMSADFAANLLSCEMLLQKANVTIRLGDFEKTVADAEKGDAIFFDPPYLPLTETANFTAYAGEFGLAEQERLAALCFDLARRGVRVVLTNHDVPVARRLYAGASKIIEIEARRTISAKAASRGVAKELLVVW